MYLFIYCFVNIVNISVTVVVVAVMAVTGHLNSDVMGFRGLVVTVV